MVKLIIFFKLLIVFLVVVVVFFGICYVMDFGFISGDGGGGSSNIGILSICIGGSVFSDDVICIGVVIWGGYVGGQYFNEGFVVNFVFCFFKEYGIDVEFVFNDDVDVFFNVWKAGDIDLYWYIIDVFLIILLGLEVFDLVVLFQVDWLCGGDVIVVCCGI